MEDATAGIVFFEVNRPSFTIVPFMADGLG
jgi:hypothetical protein